MTLRGTVAASLLKMRTLPRVGLSDRKSSLRSDVLPAPDGPVTNWKEPGAMRKLTSRSTSGPSPYLRPTFSNRITSPASLFVRLLAKHPAIKTTLTLAIDESGAK